MPHRQQATGQVRRALAPAAVAGPVLCGALLVLVELATGESIGWRRLLGQSTAVLAAVAVNLLASRHVGRRLARAQADLAQQVNSRTAAEGQLRHTVRELHGRQAFLNALLDAMDVEIVAVDSGGQPTVWNQAFRRAYGVPDLADAGAPADWAQRFGLVAADGLTPLSQQQLPLLRALAGEHVHGAEVLVWPDRHTERRLLVHARPIVLPDGTQAGALSAAHDVTELRAQQAELTRRNNDLDVLARATTAVLTGSNARQAICSAARSITDGLAVLLFEPDPDGRQLVADHTDGLDLPHVAIPVASSSRTASTYRTARTQVIADVTADPGTDQALVGLFRCLPGGADLRSSVFVPVVHHETCRAVLVVTLTRPLTTDSSRVLGLLELLAADAALALSREDLLAELARQSVTDPLTGLANRRRWDTDLQREIDRATRSGQPLSVLALDLDHFKTYNDTRGHPAGDALLRDTAAAWLRQLRPGDLLARTGGEEFAVLLPGCTGRDAARLAQALLRAVPHAQTCSAGAVQWHGDTPEHLLAHADAALYRAKAAGRNRVHLARFTTPDLPTVRLSALPGAG